MPWGRGAFGRNDAVAPLLLHVGHGACVVGKSRRLCCCGAGAPVVQLSRGACDYVVVSRRFRCCRFVAAAGSTTSTASAVTWWLVRLAESAHVKVLQGSHHGPGQAWGSPRTRSGRWGQQWGNPRGWPIAQRPATARKIISLLLKAPRQQTKEAVRRRREVIAGSLRIGGPWRLRPGLACSLLMGGYAVRAAWATVGVSGFLLSGSAVPGGLGVL